MTAECPTEFVILGSGVSTGIPRISCIIRPDSPYNCAVCHDAMYSPASKNRRGNVSALVRAAGRTVLIDCGKTIRETSMRHFPELGVRNVDAIVLTHGHADAVLGLDDCRDIQTSGTVIVDPLTGRKEWCPPDPTPVFLNTSTMATCRGVFPYLIPQPANSVKDVKRRVASLDWREYDDSTYFIPFRPVADAPIDITPIPLLHGGTYICMGFIIRLRKHFDSDDEMVIAYLSDLHDLPERTHQFVADIPRIDLLVIDMLTDSDNNTAHLSRGQAEAYVRVFRPVSAVAVGMTCSLGMHDAVNKELAEMEEEGLSFSLAYDGQRFPFPR